MTGPQAVAGIEIAEWQSTNMVEPLINGDPEGKNLLSMGQLSTSDIYDYIEAARLADQAVRDPARRGIDLLPRAVLKAIMKQPSTRTGGSMTTAMNRLGGSGELYSGMASSSEAKGEIPEHSWVAFATQADILGIRTKEDDGVHLAARAIATSYSHGKLARQVPVVNLGNGTIEHPTQALGDLFTIAKWRDFDRLDGLRVAIVGDHERYRAHHSDLLGAAALGMEVVAVESPAAPVSDAMAKALGSKLTRTTDLDEAMRQADVLIVGRNPDEYDGKDMYEQERSRQLAADYATWVIDLERLQQMRPDSIVLHPRPIKDELHPSVESDLRMRDVEQMENMIPMRMAIIARHLGVPMASFVTTPLHAV